MRRTLLRRGGTIQRCETYRAPLDEVFCSLGLEEPERALEATQ